MNTKLIRRALAVNEANLALGHETFFADGAMFVRNRDVPNIRDANHVAHVIAATPNEIDRLLRRVEEEFAGFPHRAFFLDFTTPPAFEARLQLEGYIRTEALVMLLEGKTKGKKPQHEIRAISSDADWQAFACLQQQDWREYAERTGITDDGGEVGSRMRAVLQAKQPPLQYWLAYADGEPRGYFSSWEGTDGVGQVENLYVQKEFRHRGLATALLHHCVDESRKKGAGPVVIVSDPTDTPKHMYAAMGWRPVAIKREYRRMVVVEAASEWREAGSPAAEPPSAKAEVAQMTPIS